MTTLSFFRSLGFGSRRGFFLLLVAITSLMASPVLAQGGDSDVLVSATPRHQAVAAGSVLPIAIVMDHGPGLHTWPAKEQNVLPPAIDAFAIHTEFVLNAQPELFSLAMPIQWPQASLATVPDSESGGATQAMVYQGTVVGFVALAIAEDAPLGLATATISINYQACDEASCFIPQSVVLEVDFEVLQAGATPTDGAELAIFETFVPTESQVVEVVPDEFAVVDGPIEPDQQQATTGASSSENAGVPIDFLGYQFAVATWMILPIAFLAGLILNLTPCVLPVIPIKVLSIQKHASEPGKLVLFGTVYCIGIVAFFGVLAVLVGVSGQAWGQLNGYWWFSIPLGLVVAVMGFGMMGLFTLRLPQSVYMISPSGDSVSGNFLLGVLTAILSTPCTGPMLAAVLAWASTQSPAIGVMAVLTMGIGMAFPYGLLILFPKMIDKMPRGGAGGELLKQVLGLLMFAVSVYIFSFLTTGKWTWWFVGLFASIAFGWLYIGGLRALKSANAKIVVTHMAIVGLLVTAVMTRAMTGFGAQTTASGGEISWVVFTSEKDGSISDLIDASLEDGKTVVVDFTAKWCANCHVIEKTILNSSLGKRVLLDPNVVPIKVDITNSSYTEGLAILKEFSGGASIPFIVIMGPERSRVDPVTFASFFKPSDLYGAAKEASGGKIGSDLPSVAAR